MTSVPDPDGVRAEYLRSSAQHLEAARRLREDLETHETISRQIMEAVAEGRPLAAELRLQNAAEWRPALSDSIRSFERCRHQARLALIAVGLSEGMGAAEVGELWGITRQLVSRYLREIDEHSSDDGGGAPD